jgi:flagellar biosynthesis protein FliR
LLSALFAVSPEWSAQFLLVLARVSAGLVAMPIFGAKGVPPQAKIGLALLLSLIVMPLNAHPGSHIPTNLLAFTSAVGSEALIGVCIGILIGLVVQALQMGASLVGVQIGFGMGQLLDPLTGGQTETISQFYGLLVTLVFFAVNGHHLAIIGLVKTFEVVPAGAADMSLLAGDRFAPFVASLFEFAVRVSLPVMGALLLTDLGLGLIARTIPQMNVLVEGFPVKVTIGLMVMAASMPLLTAFMGNAMTRTLPQVSSFLVAP